jgi:hypothetical protein
MLVLLLLLCGKMCIEHQRCCSLRRRMHRFFIVAAAYCEPPISAK